MNRVRGFTLIELLLVLTLIGIGSAIAIASVDRLASRSDERRWQDRTFQELKRLRNKAVLGGSTVNALLHLESGRISTSSSILLQLPDQYRFEIPPTLKATTTSDEKTLPLAFYSDGTMQEATFILVVPSGLQQQFHLEKISGRIERIQLPPRTSP